MRQKTKEIFDDICILLLSIAIILVSINGYRLEKKVAVLTDAVTQLQAELIAVKDDITDIQNDMASAQNTVKPEDPNESEKIDMALVQTGEIREDIPLDHDTQLKLRAACNEFDIPYELACAVIWQETNYQNTIGDGGNAYGYMQIWPYWNEDSMAAIGATDLMNPVDNFRTGCYLLSKNYECTGSYYDSLSIYNTGSSGPSWYADEVMAKWDSLSI